MTIAIGILCRNPARVILAADSQWTNPSDGTVSFGSKISTIRFGCSDVIVSIAGDPTIAKRVIEIVEANSKTIEISSAKIVVDAFEGAVRIMLAGLNEHQKEYLKEWRIQSILMYGFMDGYEPKLYYIDIFGYGISKQPDPGRNFAVCGCGQTLADYLLSEWGDHIDQEEMAVTIAIAVIWKVKKHQAGACGGDTNIRLVGNAGAFVRDIPVGKNILLPQETVNLSEKAIRKRVKNYEKDAFLHAKQDVEKIAQQVWKKYLAGVEKEEKEIAKTSIFAT
jgi:hypothetical protein